MRHILAYFIPKADDSGQFTGMVEVAMKELELGDAAVSVAAQPGVARHRCIKVALQHGIAAALPPVPLPQGGKPSTHQLHKILL